MKIQKTLGAGVLSLGLVLGMAGFAGAAPGDASIDTTGPRSDNVIRNRINHRVEVENDNELEVENNNYQDSLSGDARVRNNTTGGDAWSGHATNDNSFDASVDVDNSSSVDAAFASLEGLGGGGEASIENTGPRSNNRISTTVNTRVEVENDNELEVENNNTQIATSGDATVSNNTTGGDAISGDATNTNSTSVSFSVSN